MAYLPCIYSVAMLEAILVSRRGFEQILIAQREITISGTETASCGVYSRVLLGSGHFYQSEPLSESEL